MGIVNDIKALFTELPLSAVLRERLDATLEKARQFEAENESLKQQISDLQICKENQKKEIETLKQPGSFDICPYCRKPDGRLLRMEPHPTFEEMGYKVGYYKCSHCNKEYDKEIQPN